MADPPAATKGRVLVIDDEESIRHALRRGLSRSGWLVETAATGREGVEALARESFAAVLTDLKLPDLSGLDIVAVLTETRPGVPVVVMTGYGSVETALEAMRRGARDYLTKPFTVEAILEVLDRVTAERPDESRVLRAKVERRFSPAGYREAEKAIESVPPGPEARPAEPAAPPGPLPLGEARRTFEVKYLEELLARTGGSVAAAARLAGISRPNLHKKLKALGVDPHRFKRAARRGRNA